LAVLIDYIRDYIDIIISNKIEMKMKELENNNNNNLTKSEAHKYEMLIKKLEDEIRGHIKVTLILIQIENEMKMHIEYLESVYEKYEEAKKENEQYMQKNKELSENFATYEVNLNELRTECKNLKDIIKLNEVYFKNKETNLKFKISELQKKAYIVDDRLNHSQEKNKTTISFGNEYFDKV
jgi:hypothetical protein